jgi:hypothetical protein
MANAIAYKEVNAWGYQDEQMEIIYDFSVDAGAVGTVNLFKAKEAMVVTKCYAVTETGVTSAGAATIEVGIAGTTAGLIAQSAKTTVDVAGECLSGVTNLAFSLAADDVVILTIGTAALTAGKIRFRFHYAGKA